MAFQRLNNEHSSPMVQELYPIVNLPSSQLSEAYCFSIPNHHSTKQLHLSYKDQEDAWNYFDIFKTLSLSLLPGHPYPEQPPSNWTLFSLPDPPGVPLQRPPCRPIFTRLLQEWLHSLSVDAFFPWALTWAWRRRTSVQTPSSPPRHRRKAFQ